MFDTLTERLSRVVKTLRGEARLTDANIQDALREVRLALLEADVALPVVKDFVARSAREGDRRGSRRIADARPGVDRRRRARAYRADGRRGAAARSRDAAAGRDPARRPAGRGQDDDAPPSSRACSQAQKKKVLLVSADVYRPAAIEQLQTLAQQVGVDFFPSTIDEQPVAIANAALDWARRHYHDVLIVDTAGRLAIDEAMMREIAALHAAVRPIETLFVVDAMQGQDAVNTARAFRERCR